jgi:DNA-binding NarL/FixJ family response regulator
MMGGASGWVHPSDYRDRDLLPGRGHAVPRYGGDVPRRGSRLLGRSHEMAALMALLDRAEVERADPLLVVGEAGMGKTALLDEFAGAARRRGWRVARAAAPQGGDVSAFAVVEDLAHRLPEHVDGLAEEDARLLRAPPRDGTIGPARIAGALLHLLQGASSDQPVLLLVDDLQWADPGSLGALCVAVGRLGQEPVAVVAAARPRPALDPRVEAWERIEVGPLGLGDATDLLHRSLAERGCPTVTDEQQAMRLAEGLGRCPLALVEAGRLLTVEQLAGDDPLPDPLPLGARLDAAWGRSWLALPEPTRTAVLVQAVTQGVGRTLTARVLTDLGLGMDALDPAAADGLLDPRARSRADGARPAHPLIRDAILAAAGEPAVREMHARAADAAEALALPPSVVIAHLVAAAQPGDGAVTDRLLTQAERAETAGLGDAAAHALLAAAELALTAPERCRLAARAARTLTEVGTGDTTDVGPILALVDPSALGPEERFWVEWLRAEHLAEDLARSQLATERVLELAAELDSPRLAWIQFSLLNNAWGLLDEEGTLRHAAAMLALAERPDADAADRMPAWACRGMHALALFQVGQARAATTELEAIREASRYWRPAPYGNLAERVQVAAADAYLVQLDPWVDARYEELAGLLSADPGQTLGAVRIMQAERAFRRGQLLGARALLDESRALGFGAGSRSYWMFWLLVSLRVEAARGDAELVAREAAELGALAARLGWPQLVTTANRARGLLALGEGRLDDALAHLEPLDEVPLLGRGPWDDVPLGRADLIEALHRSGEADRASAVAAALVETLAPSPDPYARALVARAQGLVSRGARAQSAYATAITAFDEAGDPFEAARTRLSLGELLRRERSVGAARHELRLAADAFEQMGARAWAARALGELRATRAHIPAPAGPTPASDPLATLTPQERRVADAAAGGASDRQVAAELFLSPRTVAYHLSSVYRKLGISSRAALAARLAQSRSRHPPEGAADR